MQTKLTVEITGNTADWINAVAAELGWSNNGLISHILDQASKLADAGRLVADDAKIPAITGYDVQTRTETTFEVGEMVNCQWAEDEAWLMGMVLSIGAEGVEVQLTAQSAKMYDGSARDLWSPEALHPVK